jgi:hypothetical protein
MPVDQTNRRDFITGLSGAALPVAAFAQQQRTIPRVGLVSTTLWPSKPGRSFPRSACGRGGPGDRRPARSVLSPQPLIFFSVERVRPWAVSFPA